MKKVTIIGTGAYGTALANVLADGGNEVIMYGVVEDQVNDIDVNHLNSQFFGKELSINNKVRATTDLASAVENAEYIVLGVPTKALNSVINDLNKYIKKDAVIINTAKGLEDETGNYLLSKYVINKFAGNKFIRGYVGLYGPSIASEVLSRKPTFVNVAGDNQALLDEVASTFTNEYFIARTCLDLPGCEISAALKNTIAIGCGMLYELGAGDNAQASLITVGLNEIKEIAKKFGAKDETFFNYATVGDLVLTASSKKSRNFTLGRKIVEFGNYEKAIENYNLTVEGVFSAKIGHEICQNMRISSRLIEVIYDIIYNNNKPIALINNVFKN